MCPRLLEHPVLPRIEHVSIFPASYLPNHLDESRFVADDLNFLILVEMLWTVEETKLSIF